MLSPDLIISIRYGGILKEEVFAVPTKGVINLHSGILPNYRGVMASFWAMINDEHDIGTTLHTITDSSIDTGNIIKISTSPADKDKSYLSHVLELYEQGVSEIIDVVNTVQQNKTLPAFPQAQSHSYFTFPTEIDFEAFEQKGLQLVNELEYMQFMKKHYFV